MIKYSVLLFSMIFLSSCSQFDGSFLSSNDPVIELQDDSFAEDVRPTLKIYRDFMEVI